MKVKVTAFIIACVAAAYLASCQSDEQLDFKRYYTAGAEIYQTRCQNCHGLSGEGLSSLIPPLTDSVFLKKNIHLLSCYLNEGMERPLTVNGKAYQGKMPAANLSPIELARVLTYIGNSFGNQLKTIPISQTSIDIANCK